MQSKRRVLITGTSSGIGLAIAQFFLDAGDLVTGLDLSTPALTHPNFTPCQIDLADPHVIDDFLSRCGEFDAFIHCAGLLRVSPLGELKSDDLETMWRIHVAAATQIANIVIPRMAARHGGRVVLIGSRVAQGMAGRSQYAATKAALIALAKSWASETVASGVTVNVVSPAATHTAMLDDPARQSVQPKMPPIGRLIQPLEIASLVGYLLSPMAEAITGQDIQICGGASLSR